MNDNQEIVFNWLKETHSNGTMTPMLMFSAFGWEHFGASLPEGVETAYRKMDNKQDLQVLQAFAEWGLSKED